MSRKKAGMLDAKRTGPRPGLSVRNDGFD